MNKTEILAPVGNTEMLYAAAKSGADAVYLGAEEFNARRNAENFNNEDLKEAVKYCHIRGIKVYLTLNILISDSEFSDAVNLCFKAYNSGIDAIIIADLGLSAYISKALPMLHLHASTQMTVYSKEALYPLKEMGFKRVVLARELSKEKIREITLKAAELDMETEVFVHGALCMCVSGQCLMSAFLGGRSGNRGLCAGPCRLPFSAVHKKDDYALSLKDLSLLAYLKELEGMGVASFKIEGRMKRPEYVAAAVTACRQSLNGELSEEINSYLKGVFSRSGFTDGYYTSNSGKDMFGIRSKDDVAKLSSVLPKIHELYRKELSRVPLKAQFSLKLNKKAKFSLDDGKNSVTVYGNTGEVPKNIALNKETALKNLSKLGSTPYYIEKFCFESDNISTLRASDLNELRRNAAAELDKMRSRTPDKLFPCEIPALPFVKRKFTGYILRVNSLDSIPDDLSRVAFISVPAENLLNKNYSDFEKIIAELPRINESDDFIESCLEKIKEKGITKVSVGNISQLKKAKELGFQIMFGFGTNIFSSFSCLFAEQNGAAAVVLSPEMTVNQINSINTNIKTVFISYGKLPLMIFKNCPVKNALGCENCDKNKTLTDRKNIEFKVKCRLGFSELYNSKPIYLAERQNEFNTDYSLLYFSDESKEDIENILNLYRKNEKADGSFTRGLYYKGVL